jgi:hypothetical protein
MNYTALQAAVSEYLDRTDLTETDLIERARVRIGTELRSLEQITTTTLSSFTNGVASLPAGFQEMIEVRSSDVPLRPVNYHELGYWLSAGSPAVYAIYGRNIHIPGASSADIWYFQQEAALSSGATEHATMAAFPQLWIYAAVAEGARIEKNWELADRMELAFQQLRDTINAQASRARFGPAPATVDSGRNALASAPGL